MRNTSNIIRQRCLIYQHLGIAHIFFPLVEHRQGRELASMHYGTQETASFTEQDHWRIR